jgi:uncharacterized delta-60 repeat protein
MPMRLRRLLGARRAPPKATPKRGYRPVLDRLEDRSLLNGGDLDPTFGTGGKVLTGFTGALNESNHFLARTPDGKVLVACDSYDGDLNQVALVRYLAGRQLDPTFGTEGTMRLVFHGHDTQLGALAVQPDGKILLADAGDPTSPTGAGFELFRLTADGNPDSGFGQGGRTLTDFGNTYGRPGSILLEPDGRIVVVGFIIRPSADRDHQHQFAVARYNPDGTLDMSFGAEGWLTGAPQPSVTGGNHTVGALQADGRIVVAQTFGYAIGALAYSDFFVARLNADGSVDSGFGNQGRVVTGIGGGRVVYQAQAVALQGDGKILVAGNTQYGPGISIAPLGSVLLRYNPDGTLDGGFGSVGQVLPGTPDSADRVTSALAVDSARIYVGGSRDLRVFRYDADGTLDRTFGNQGVASKIVDSQMPGPEALLVAAGQVYAAAQIDQGIRRDVGLCRFGTDGTPDTGFGTDGLAVTSFVGTVAATVADAIRQPDGKIVAVGYVKDGVDAYAVVRYRPDGGLDDAFGSGGRVVGRFPPGSDTSFDGQALAVDLQSDGKILIAGTAAGVGRVARLLPDGRLDTTFASAGYFGLPNTPPATIEDIIVQPDDKIVVVGIYFDAQAGFVAFALRLTPEGTIDLPATDVGKPSSGLRGIGNLWLILRPDGSLLVTGLSDGIRRVRPDLSPDAGYTPAGLGVGRAALTPDGQAVAIAYGYTPSYQDPRFPATIARYSADTGQRDRAFGIDGYTGEPAYAVIFPGELLVQPNGVILVGVSEESPAFQVAAFTPSGSFASSFGSGGMVSATVTAGAQGVLALVPQPDNHFVAAGYATVNGVRQFALARLEGASDPVPTPPGPEPTPTPPGPEPTPTPASNDNVSYLTGLYCQLLGRTPDTSGLVAFGPTLDTARFAALSTVATGFVSSAENRGRFIRSGYEALLGRTPGPSEVALWLLVFQTASPEQVLVDLTASEEAFGRAGGTDAFWLDTVYQRLLGRARGATETSLLTALRGGASRAQIAAVIVSSPEFRTRLVRQTFATYLGRDAGPGDLAAWLPQLALAFAPGQPAPSERFLAAVLSSSERLAHNDNNNDTWLDGLYHDLLRRDPDASGLASQRDALLSAYAGQRQAVALAFLNSDEFRRKEIGDIYQQFLKRAASPAEINGWANSAAPNATNQNLVALVLASDEYFRRAGGTTAGWVEQLLHDLVAGDPEHFRTLFQGLAAATPNRADAASRILAQSDYLQYRAGTLYLAHLGRPPRPRQPSGAAC